MLAVRLRLCARLWLEAYSLRVRIGGKFDCGMIIDAACWGRTSDIRMYISRYLQWGHLGSHIAVESPDVSHISVRLKVDLKPLLRRARSSQPFGTGL